MTDTPAMQAARRIFRPTNDQAVEQVAELIEALRDLKPILDSAESNASGNPEWEYVSKRVNAARAAIAKVGVA